MPDSSFPYKFLLQTGATNAPLSYMVNHFPGNDSNLLTVFYVQIMPDDFVMQLHRF
ncbi:beta-galactosidase [Escherichia coli]|nr:beta-galactosidase [Escherichia coli]